MEGVVYSTPPGPGARRHLRGVRGGEEPARGGRGQLQDSLQVGYGMVWCGVVWYGVVWCGMVWYRMLQYCTVWYVFADYGMVWYGPYHNIPYGSD